MTNISFDPKGQNVQLEIKFGHAQEGRYEIRLNDNRGIFIPGTEKKGNNIDEISDRFDIPLSPDELDSKIILWTLMIASPSDKPGELYSASLTFTQNGKNLSGSPVSYSGALDGGKLHLGRARFAAST